MRRITRRSVPLVVLLGVFVATGIFCASNPSVAAPEDVPGDRVQWQRFLPQRRQLALEPFLSDVVNHLPVVYGEQYFDRDKVTWAHETTHGIHAHLRNAVGRHRAVFYVGNDQAAIVEQPKLTLKQIAEVIPKALRGVRYELYLVKQAKEWDDSPLYLWDEWVAYVNGARTALELKPAGDVLDDRVAAPLEFIAYGVGVAVAAKKHDPDYLRYPQFREFLAHELRRTCYYYRVGQGIPQYHWDTKFETSLKAEREFLTILDELYDGRLSLARLLP